MTDTVRPVLLLFAAAAPLGSERSMLMEKKAEKQDSTLDVRSPPRKLSERYSYNPISRQSGHWHGMTLAGPGDDVCRGANRRSRIVVYCGVGEEYEDAPPLHASCDCRGSGNPSELGQRHAAAAPEIHPRGQRGRLAGSADLHQEQRRPVHRGSQIQRGLLCLRRGEPLLL